MDFSNCCRFCVKEIGSSTRNYLTPDLKDKFKYLTDLDLPDCDLYSNFSCSSCVNNLMMGIDIKENFINMQKFLHRSSDQHFKTENEIPLEYETNDVQELAFVTIKEEPLDIKPIQPDLESSDNVIYLQSEDSKQKKNDQRKSKVKSKVEEKTQSRVKQANISKEKKTNVKDTVNQKSEKAKKSNYCEKCRTNILGSMSSHIVKIHDTIARFICDSCGRGFHNKFKLKEHLRRHFNIKLFACQTCGKPFVTNGALASHINIVHKNIKPNYVVIRRICEICGKSVSNSHMYNIHMLTQHEGVKAFVCDVEGCSERFHHKEKLFRHKKMKHEPTKFVQCQICNKIVKHRLRNHIRACHTERKFICEFEVDGNQCSKKFVELNHLKRHVAISHQGFKKFKCEYCESSYSKLLDLENHRNVIHLKLKIKCELCSTLVTKKDYYRRHILLNHKELDEVTKNALLEKIKSTPRNELFNTQLPMT